MIVDVYDTYAKSPSGATIHFDVLVPAKTSPETAFGYALEWLKKVDLADAELKQARCRFCHSENAGAKIVSDIQRDGYHIIRMEGCPKEE
jgi:Domain of unknown function (DUF2024)